MPNWCHNGITLRHTDPAMIDRVQNSDGLLMEFLPTPQDLLDTMSGFQSDSEKQRELEDQQQANLGKYGATDWHDWNIQNWGTKWDFNLENVERVDDNTLTAAFDSAWTPPINAYIELCKLGFEIKALYYEPGNALLGKFVGNKDEYNNDYIEYYSADSETVRDIIGEELDDYFGISAEMSQYDEQEDDRITSS